jgi:hypothetical protein
MTISSPGIALAGGKVASALLDLLVEKGIITKDDARTVLNNAIKASPMPDVDTVSANGIIASMLSGKYSARG